MDVALRMLLIRRRGLYGTISLSLSQMAQAVGRNVAMGINRPAEKGISLRYSRYWLSFDVTKDWLGIYDACQEAFNCNPQDSKIRLAFSLSAASFSSSRIDYADIIPVILILATDIKVRGLLRPPLSHYELSDGTYPDYTRLSNLISQSALPLERTPAQTMEVRAA